MATFGVDPQILRLIEEKSGFTYIFLSLFVSSLPCLYTFLAYHPNICVVK